VLLTARNVAVIDTKLIPEDLGFGKMLTCSFKSLILDTISTPSKVFSVKKLNNYVKTS